MGTPYLCEMKIFSFNFAPKGWSMCNGQLLSINQNQALFSLLGTTYGGNGIQTFGLPNLQGRVPMHIGTNFIQGQIGGEVAHTLTMGEMPAHTHQLLASSNSPNINTPANNYLATGGGYTPYATNTNETMAPQALANTGGNQPHENMSPYVVLNICIALQGIFPSRN